MTLRMATMVTTKTLATTKTTATRTRTLSYLALTTSRSSILTKPTKAPTKTRIRRQSFEDLGVTSGLGIHCTIVTLYDLIDVILLSSSRKPPRDSPLLPKTYYSIELLEWHFFAREKRDLELSLGGGRRVGL